MTLFKNMSNLKQRLSISGIIVTILLISLYFSYNPTFKPLFALLTAGAICCALWEYYQIAIAKDLKPMVNLGLASTLIYVVATFLAVHGIDGPVLPFFILFLSLLIFCVYALYKDERPLVNLSVTCFGIVYIVLPLTLMININYFFGLEGLQDGRIWLLYLLAVTKMTDTGAYIMGKRFGKSKLAPHISPKKTNMGALGGMLFSIATSFLFYLVSLLFPQMFSISLTFLNSICLGFAIGFLAQIGDLVESLLKRDGGIKDSNQLPGLGGMLDMVDSLIFTTPLVYFFIKNVSL